MSPYVRSVTFPGYPPISHSCGVRQTCSPVGTPISRNCRARQSWSPVDTPISRISRSRQTCSPVGTQSFGIGGPVATSLASFAFLPSSSAIKKTTTKKPKSNLLIYLFLYFSPFLYLFLFSLFFLFTTSITITTITITIFLLTIYYYYIFSFYLFILFPKKTLFHLGEPIPNPRSLYYYITHFENYTLSLIFSKIPFFPFIFFPKGHRSR